MISHRLLLLAAALTLHLALPTGFAAESDSPFQQKQDLVYGEVHGTGLLMDVFTPTGKANGLAIVDVVSGAWSSDRNKIRDHTLSQMFHIYCGRGYTVFAVRPGSKTRYTATEMQRHVKIGIRYVKEHAADYGIDPQRLGLTGASAGGHLATLAALTPEAGKPDSKRPAQRFGTDVQAVGVFFPPTDLVDWDEGKPADPKILLPLLSIGEGSPLSDDEVKKRAREASPLHRITKPGPPFLLIHGNADLVVPLSHSERLVKAIKEHGGSAELIVKQGGGHPWLTLPEEVKVMADWFDQHLLKKE